MCRDRCGSHQLRRSPAAHSRPSSTSGATATDTTDSFTGTKKIEVDGRSVNVSCSSEPSAGQPVIVLLHGGGDDLKKLAGLQETLAEQDRVWS